jgi:acyl-CoA thioesterase YciA
MAGSGGSFEVGKRRMTAAGNRVVYSGLRATGSARTPRAGQLRPRFPVQFVITVLSQKAPGAADTGSAGQAAAVLCLPRHSPLFCGRPMTDALQLPQKPPALRVVPQPSDANVHGDVFGGWIMSQVDIAGSIPASRRANGRVATVAVNSFVFKQPVFVGDLLSFYAKIVKTGTTSVTVEVEVYAQRMRLADEVVKVTEATLTYVATGNDRRPRALPPVA